MRLFHSRSCLAALLPLAGSIMLGACSMDSHGISLDVQSNALNGNECKAHKDLLKFALARHFPDTTDVTDPAFDDDDVSAGRRAFDDRKLHGLGANGRACADCHNASDSFSLTPARALERWNALQACRAVNPDADDPLFRAIDADNPSGAFAQGNFSHLINNGQIRVKFKLPSVDHTGTPVPNVNTPQIRVVIPESCKNTDGSPASCQTAPVYDVSDEADVWRGVPTVLNVASSGPDSQTVWARPPNQGGGFQFDGRFGTLEEQALGALVGHAEVQADPSATLTMRSNLATFQLTQQPSAEPVLQEGSPEAQGRAIFQRACTTCHGGPAGSTPTQPSVAESTAIAHYHDVRATCPRPADTATTKRWDFTAAALAGGSKKDPCGPDQTRNSRTYEIRYASGLVVRRTTTDPGRALTTGYVVSGPAGCAHPPCGAGPRDDWMKFDIMPTHGVALSKTAPYFHNNSAATLEDVVIHYEEFFKQVSALNTASQPTNVLLTTRTMSCTDPACPSTQRGETCSADNWCRDRANTADERAALVAYLNRL
jgi:cytochrome c peroxidase